MNIFRAVYSEELYTANVLVEYADCLLYLAESIKLVDKEKSQQYYQEASTKVQHALKLEV